MRYPETLRYETSAGEYVRSKSEVIIANLLYAKSDKLLYKYERPLLLKNHGQEIIHISGFYNFKYGNWRDNVLGACRTYE